MADKSAHASATQATESADQPTAATGRLGALLARFKSTKWKIAAAGTLGSAGILLSLMLFTGGEPVVPPEEQLRTALALLDESGKPEDLEAAGQIAMALDRANYRHPDFPGAPEYIQGIVAFREAAGPGHDEDDQLAAYRRGADLLHKAEVRTLDKSRRPEWCFAIGTCLFHLGDAKGAEARLQEAADTYPLEQRAALTMLQEIYLNHRTEKSLNRAVELNTQLLEQQGLEQTPRDEAYLRRAELLLLLGKTAEAEAALANISEQFSDRKAAQVIRAEADLAAQRYAEARERLRPVLEAAGLEPLYARQAAYLIGLSFELQGEFDNASTAYGDTMRLYPHTAEGLAASVRRADLLRKDKRTEEALDHYKDALGQVQPEGFSSRWLTTGEFKNSILAAWQDWSQSQEYKAAIELSQHMTPLFEQSEALKQETLAYEQWALQLEKILAESRNPVRIRRESERRTRWRRSAAALAALAETQTDTAAYSDILWNCAEHYHKGRDSEKELELITRFINTNPQARMALAYVRRGRVLMDLDRMDEALEQFEKVLRDFPIDIAAFEARYLIGQCHLERNQPELAEKAWRSILTSPNLDPSAGEWQMSLFALGRLLFQTAAILDSKARADLKKYEADGPPAEANARWEESIQKLDEFLRRYPQRPEVMEARSLLAKALQHSADLPRYKLNKNAETENARKELTAAINGLLNRAHAEYTTLQEQLIERDKTESLDEFAQQLLRDCYFENAHTLFALGDYEKAIAAYTSAAVRYSEDPLTLLAYLQIANCYAQMGKRGDAIGVAVQALLIHRKLPDTAFQTGTSSISRDEWKSWLEWAREVLQSQPTGPAQLSARPINRL